VLTEHRTALERLTTELITKETVEEEEIDEIAARSTPSATRPVAIA
jgi:ATP-dependent Zn protease